MNGMTTMNSMSGSGLRHGGEPGPRRGSMTSGDTEKGAMSRCPTCGYEHPKGELEGKTLTARVEGGKIVIGSDAAPMPMGTTEAPASYDAASVIDRNA